MNLPSFWRQAAFSVAESADILAVPEDTLRTWMARCPFNDYMGTKTGGRIFLSGAELFFWAVVRDLSGYGVGLRVAMHSASPLAENASQFLPNIERLVVRKTAPDVWNFELTDDPQFELTSALVIPLRALALNIIGRGGVIYMQESA